MSGLTYHGRLGSGRPADAEPGGDRRPCLGSPPPTASRSGAERVPPGTPPGRAHHHPGRRQPVSSPVTCGVDGQGRIVISTTASGPRPQRPPRPAGVHLRALRRLGRPVRRTSTGWRRCSTCPRPSTASSTTTAASPRTSRRDGTAPPCRPGQVPAAGHHRALGTDRHRRHPAGGPDKLAPPCTLSPEPTARPRPRRRTGPRSTPGSPPATRRPRRVARRCRAGPGWPSPRDHRRRVAQA